MRRPLKPLSHNRCTRPAARARKANDWAPRYVGRGCGCCRFADGGEVRMGPSDTCRAGRPRAPSSADATSVSAIAMRPSMVAMRRFSRAAARGAASASADAALLSAAHGRQAAYRKQPAASRRQRRAAAASVESGSMHDVADITPVSESSSASASSRRSSSPSLSLDASPTQVRALAAPAPSAGAEPMLDAAGICSACMSATPARAACHAAARDRLRRCLLLSQG